MGRARLHRAATITCVLLCASCCYAKTRKPRPRRELLPPETGPTNELIFDSGLLEKTVSAASLHEKSRQYYADTSIKRFKGPVLGYVTPWNRQGYENAVVFRAKFTHISPVWYQLKRHKDKGWVLEGGHEYNKTWVDEVRSPVTEGSDPTCRVVPRVIVELDNPQDHVALVTHATADVIETLMSEVMDKQYDGLVLEVWMTWVYINGLSNDQFSQAALAFTKSLYTALDDQGRQLVMAVPPPVPQGYSRPYIERKSLEQFSPYVHYWSIMTYDYAGGPGPQPNSPLHWLQQQTKILLEKIEDSNILVRPDQALMGVNFYGYDFSLRDQAARDAITADGFMTLLRQQPDLEWNDNDGEHHFKYKAADGPHRVYYPTPRALELRLEMFMKLGLGVSIWELGQGLERFFDLL